jgi:hypothetical protein
MLPSGHAQLSDPGGHRPSCNEIRKRLKRNGADMTMLDPEPDLVQNSRLTSDPDILATRGRQVRGITADGMSIVLLRFRVNFPDERLQITLLNAAGKPSSSADQDGLLADITNTQPGSPSPFLSLSLSSSVGPGPLTVTALKSRKGAFAFALYRAPTDFVRNESDYDKSSRPFSFEVRSLDLPCFTYIWPSAH